MSESVVKSVEKEIIDWETSVAIINLNQKNTHYIKKEKSQKKRAKWVSKEKFKKKIKKKQCIQYKLLGHFIKICPHLLSQRPVQIIILKKKPIVIAKF